MELTFPPMFAQRSPGLRDNWRALTLSCARSESELGAGFRFSGKSWSCAFTLTRDVDFRYMDGWRRWVDAWVER